MIIYNGSFATAILGFVMGVVLGFSIDWIQIGMLLLAMGVILLTAYPLIVSIESRYVGVSSVLPPTIEGLKAVNQQESIAFLVFAVIGALLPICL